MCRTASLVKVCFQIEETQLRGGSIPVQATNLVSAVGSQTQKPVNLRLGLPDVYAGNRASDDQSLDFASPLEDRVDLRVTVPALDRILANVAVTAEDLNGLFGDLHGRFAGVELGHRALAIEERLTCRGHPRRAPDEQT